ncbi:methyltransferase domain-containing protein [Rubinisphaera sp.]|uniref:methyltransferase domain-containing protein n=1 Tax=Rubinisphaera sp. TaxID=2024857 RepID=UPI000C122007|nr:methyltransferase domain-containing protein [Rubinisphaera sp.]MBV11957.1 methyltransferase [Rubinisphaera sp.]HCS55222.1 methyltransferase [Planctomycetaceae bacterium]
MSETNGNLIQIQSGNLNVDQAVRDRYSGAAQEREAALCCPVSYDRQYLEMIPEEIIERDYGCGDPSKHVSAGEMVLDLGSGGGKICYIAAQIVGKAGRVIGVDCNLEMLGLARKYQAEMSEKLGYDVVSFRRGKIEDLKLDLDLLEERLKSKPVSSSSDWLETQELIESLREDHPLVAENSVDVVVSNCVLNLVSKEKRRQLFAEIFRVLKPGGRAVISDITSDVDVPLELQNDATLWSGCISGAFREDEFLQVFEEAGFYGCEILERQFEPWMTVQGIEFRSMTVCSYKPETGSVKDRSHTVIYKGPWKEVVDDNGNRLIRGQRKSVSENTFNRYAKAPYQGNIIPVDTNDSQNETSTTNCCDSKGSCC